MSGSDDAGVVGGAHVPTPAMTLDGISKAYGTNRALADVSFEVQPASVHGLLGGNGSGKSTLIKILAGVVEADSGRMRVGEGWNELATHSPRRAGELGLRFVHQQNSTFGDLTIAENLAIERGFETQVGRINWSAQKRWAQTVLDRFEIPAHPSTPVSELGAAMQMMVAIARALQDTDGSDNGTLILDEPTASLPRHEVDVLLDALTRFARAGQSIMIVTHRLPEVMSVCDRATVLRDGVVAANIERSEITHDRLVSEIMGRRLAGLVKAESATKRDGAGQDVLVVRAKSSDAQDIVVGAGEVVGLAGLLGSGRSSLLRRIFGQNERVEEVIIDGVPVTTKGPVGAMSAGVAFVPEDRPREALFPDLSISENLSIAKQRDSSRGIRISSTLERRRAKDLISSFAVKAASEALPLASLSGGNQQKIILARWMQRTPKVLLLDEPTQGVDVGAREELHRIIRGAAADGAAVLVVSSEFEELVALCDRALIVHDGRVVDEVPAAELNEEALNNRVYAKEVLS